MSKKKEKIKVWDKPQLGGVYKEEKPSLLENLLRFFKKERKENKE